MTTEDDFQRLLDADPRDHATRGVFADWLRDRGDPRADGYYVISLGRLYPLNYCYAADNGKPSWYWMSTITGRMSGSLIKDWWHNKLANQTYVWTRRKAEDDLALAFTRLPPDRQARLLQGDFS